MSAQQPIQQQYYTREREGIFRSNEGYDTIAKSPRLDNNFIKKVLHPFCTYDAPKELQERSRKDITQYPESLTLFQPESGELVIGRSIYAGADFTGQRNTFFMHNYIIPRERKEDFIQNPARLFQIKDFVDTYDIGAGKELPERSDIAHGNERCLYNWKPLFEKLGITGQVFKQLLYAVMMSAGSKKKVYISLNVDITESSVYAKQLLEVLFCCLPYEMRRNVGFITHSNEPQSKKYINVMFVEKGGIRPGAHDIEKDYVFDFANGRFINTDLPGQEHIYLQFVWEKLGGYANFEPFFVFAEEALQGVDNARKLALPVYYELCALFLIEQGETNIYERNRAGILHSVLGYLEQSNLTQKKGLHTFLLQLLAKESKAVSMRSLPPLEVIKCFIAYYGIAPDRERAEVSLFLINTLLKGKQARERSFVFDVYQSISANKQLFASLMRSILRSKVDQSLFEEYVEQRLAALGGVSEVVQEIRFWRDTVPDCVTNRYFQEGTLNAFVERLDKENDRIGAVTKIYQAFDQLGDSDKDKLAFTKYASAILGEIDMHLVEGIELSRLSGEECSQAVQILKRQKQTFAKDLSREGKRNHELLLAVDEARSAGTASDPEDIFKKLDDEDVRTVQEMLQRFLKDSISPAVFKEITLAFYNPGYHHSPQADGAYRYGEMIDYLYKNKGADTVRAFIKWSVDRKTALHGGTAIPKPYRNAIKKYLVKNDRESLKKRAERRQWDGIQSRDFKKLFEEARDEVSSGAARFFRKNKEKVVLIMLAIVLLGGSGFAVYKFWPQSTHTTPQKDTTPKK